MSPIPLFAAPALVERKKLISTSGHSGSCTNGILSGAKRLDARNSRVSVTILGCLLIVGLPPDLAFADQSSLTSGSVRLATIMLALVGALSYGMADFLGGLASRRIGPTHAAAVVQVLAASAAFAFMLIDGGSVPIQGDLFKSLCAGVCYAAAVAMLYYGLANGSFSVIAPLSGLISISVPAIAESLLIRSLTGQEFSGIILAASSIVMIAASLHNATGGTRQEFSVLAGLLSGLGFGMADALLGTMTPEQSTGTLFIAQLIAAGCTLVALTRLQIANAALTRNLSALSVVEAGPNVTKTARAFETPALGLANSGAARLRSTFEFGFSLALLAGVLDAFGHLGYIVAATRDSMGIAAAVVALFPCVSVLLAVLVLQERLNFLLSCGILTTIASVVLLAVS